MIKFCWWYDADADDNMAFKTEKTQLYCRRPIRNYCSNYSAEKRPKHVPLDYSKMYFHFIRDSSLKIDPFCGRSKLWQQFSWLHDCTKTVENGSLRSTIPMLNPSTYRLHCKLICFKICVKCILTMKSTLETPENLFMINIWLNFEFIKDVEILFSHFCKTEF